MVKPVAWYIFVPTPWDRWAWTRCNQPCAWERLYSQWCRLLGLRETSVYVCPYRLWLQRGSHIACLTCLVQLPVGLLLLHTGQREEEVITYQIAPLSTLSTHARLIYSRIHVDILRYELWAPLINYSDAKWKKPSACTTSKHIHYKQSLTSNYTIIIVLLTPF